MIKIIKYTFLTLAILVIAALFIWQKDAGQIKLAAINMAIEGDLSADDVQATKSTTTLEKPRYQGRDKNGKKWLISADRALQQGTLNDGTITLINTNADFLTIDSNNNIHFTAGNGLYTRSSNAASETLTLSDHVIVKGYGLNLETEHISTNIHTREIVAPSKITLTGALSGLNIHLVAGAFRYAPATNTTDEIFKLTGGLTARLTPLTEQ